MDVIELTKALIRFDTINPPGNERACAEFLGQLLARAGFDVARHEHAPGRTSLLVRIGDTSERPLCFAGHIDTVPLGAAPWSRDPFAGEIADGRLYGRGASDMKSGVAAFVSAAVRVAPRLRGAAGLVLVISQSRHVVRRAIGSPRSLRIAAYRFQIRAGDLCEFEVPHRSAKSASI